MSILMSDVLRIIVTFLLIKLKSYLNNVSEYMFVVFLMNVKKNSWWMIEMYLGIWQKFLFLENI